jgi:hypothetical protein
LTDTEEDCKQEIAIQQNKAYVMTVLGTISKVGRDDTLYALCAGNGANV